MLHTYIKPSESSAIFDPVSLGQVFVIQCWVHPGVCVLTCLDSKSSLCGLAKVAFQLSGSCLGHRFQSWVLRNTDLVPSK